MSRLYAYHVSMGGNYWELTCYLKKQPGCESLELFQEDQSRLQTSGCVREGRDPVV